jgi:hypothetical protein
VPGRGGRAVMGGIMALPRWRRGGINRGFKEGNQGGAWLRLDPASRGVKPSGGAAEGSGIWWWSHRAWVAQEVDKANRWGPLTSGCKRRAKVARGHQGRCRPVGSGEGGDGLGRSGPARRRGLVSKEKSSMDLIFKFQNLARLWKFIKGDLEGIST